jgi:NitT/TauT family transport system substrate-binding protein
MIRCALLSVTLIVALIVPASSQERVRVGTQRLISNGPLFLADARGYFRAEGLDVAMTSYPSSQQVVEALAAGATEFGLTDFTALAFNLAGQGKIKAIAAQAREKQDHEGNEIVASIAASEVGLRKVEHLANKRVAISQIDSSDHYQLSRIAQLKGFDLAGVKVKALQSLDAMARAVSTGEVDATILPTLYARELMVSNQARLVSWYSEFDEQQLGALFVSAATLQARRATVEKFVRAYRRGTADYAASLLRSDRFRKRISDAKSQSAATTIARYVYPGKPVGSAAITVEAGAYFIDAQARLDVADLERQIAWYKSQGLVDPGVDARNVVDLSFVGSP